MPPQRAPRHSIRRQPVPSPNRPNTLGSKPEARAPKEAQAMHFGSALSVSLMVDSSGPGCTWRTTGRADVRVARPAGDLPETRTRFDLKQRSPVERVVDGADRFCRHTVGEDAIGYVAHHHRAR